MSRILIVEDDAIIAEAVSALLDHAGHQVVGVARDESSAVRHADSERPDLVLLDIKLAEGSDGIETARRLQAVDAVPVVFMTACRDQQTLDRAAAVKPAGFLAKPFSPEQLMDVLNCCRSHSAPQPPGRPAKPSRS